MAVVSSATAATALHIPHNNRELLPSLLSKSTKINGSLIISLIKTNNTTTSNYARKTRFQIIRSSSEDAASSSSSSSSATATEEEGWNESSDESSPAELAKGPPSLISALNVEKALRGIAITDVDHYARLGLRMGCTYNQVRLAYQKMVNELSSQGLDEEEFNKKLELLKESYTILSSEEERRLYDWSLARSEKPDRYAWPFEVDITQAPNSPDTPPAQEPENVGPTRLVGYFLLGWLVLAFILSIGLNL